MPYREVAISDSEKRTILRAAGLHTSRRQRRVKCPIQLIDGFDAPHMSAMRPLVAIDTRLSFTQVTVGKGWIIQHCG